MAWLPGIQHVFHIRFCDRGIRLIGVWTGKNFLVELLHNGQSNVETERLIRRIETPRRMQCQDDNFTMPTLEDCNIKRNRISLKPIIIHWITRQGIGDIGVSTSCPLQYFTCPSRFMFLMTVLKPFVPAPGPVSVQKFDTKSALTSLGYSIWKTGFEALTKAEKAEQSEYWTHCSLTAN